MAYTAVELAELERIMIEAQRPRSTHGSDLRRIVVSATISAQTAIMDVGPVAV